MAYEPIRDAGTEGAFVGPWPVASRSQVRTTLRPLEDALDRDDLERRWSEAVLAAEGGGAARVWILCAAGAGALSVSHAWPDHGSRDGTIGSEALGRPEIGPAPPMGDADPGVDSTAELDPLQCGRAVAEAWRDRVIACSREPSVAGPWSGAACVAAVGYRCDAGPGRLLVAAWDVEVATWAEQEDRFTALARWGLQVARSLELRECERRSSEQRAALAEWARAASASHHLIEGLRAAAQAVLRVSGSPAAAIWTLGVEGAPCLAQTAGEVPERESLARSLQSLAEAAVEQATLQCFDGDAAQPTRDQVRPAECGPQAQETPPAVLDDIRRAVLVPVIAFGQVLGVLAAIDLVSRLKEDPASAESSGHESLLAVADGLGMLLDRSARAQEQRASEQQARELRARLRRRERLATVGERASEALAEARHPVASIGAFARRAHRELDAGDPRREYLEVILRESERLERLIAESAEPLAPEPPRFRMESLNAVLQDVLPGVGEKLVRRRVRLLKRLDPESPRLLLDVERIRQVFRNVIERAVDSVPVGGRVRVESRLIRDHVIAEIAFDGAHSPGELLEELFVPFTAGAASGAPALGVADQIIRQHGGEIRVRADGEWGATILVTLPVRGNEERRRTRSDRRLTRPDRREPASST